MREYYFIAFYFIQNYSELKFQACNFDLIALISDKKKRIIIGMFESEQVEGTLFDFGTVAETQIMKVQDELYLPYNPFTFDIKLRIIKSIEPYQSNICFTINAGCKSIFGRKKAQVQHLLKAPTVSSKHFAIDQNKKIYDLGSTKGTFIWIQRQKPVSLEKGKSFLIGKSQVMIQNLFINQRKITLKVDSKLIQLNKKDNPIFIGSHKRCHIKISGKQYYTAIDLTNMKLHNFLQNQDYDCQFGVWERLSGKKQQSEGRQIEPQDIFMVYPYILKAEY